MDELERAEGMSCQLNACIPEMESVDELCEYME